MRRPALTAALAAVLLLPACGRDAPSASATRSAPPELSVAAAASLRELLESTREAFAVAHGGARLSFSFEASSTLSRQIEEGGAFGAFLSADAANVDRIAARLQADTRRVFLSNRLALVGRSDLAAPPADPAALAAGSFSLALAGPAVPAGRYARACLERMGLLATLEPRAVVADDVRAALALVESGTVDTAFVYLTDARLAQDARLLWMAPPEDDPGISYVAAAVLDAPALARDYVAWLGSEAFLVRAEELGFLRPAP
jgi:molybdate transport system substrate-binding protein